MNRLRRVAGGKGSVPKCPRPEFGYRDSRKEKKNPSPVHKNKVAFFLNLHFIKIQLIKYRSYNDSTYLFDTKSNITLP